MNRSAWRAALLAATVLTAAATCGGQTEDVKVHFGFDGRSRAECWTPVLVEIPPGFVDESVEGRLAIQSSGSDRADRGRFQLPVVLTAETDAAGSVDRQWLYVRPGPDLYRGTAYLEAGGRRLRNLFIDRELARNTLPEQPVVILVAGPPLGLNRVIEGEGSRADGSTGYPYLGHYGVVRCDVPDRLPDRAIGYECVDVLVLVDAVVDQDLSRDQVEAVIGFVETGGRLVVVMSRPAQVPADSPLAAILPAEAQDPVAVADGGAFAVAAGAGAAALRGEVTVVPLRPRRQSVVRFNADRRSVAVEGAYGLGSVLVVGLDVQDSAFRAWNDSPRFFARLLRFQPERFTPGTSIPCGTRAKQSIVPPGGSVAFFWALMLLGICYVVAIGPGLYVAIRSARWWSLSWPIYLAVSLAAAAGCFALVATVRNRKVTATTLTVVDWPAEGDVATGRSWHNVRFPDSSLYDVRLAAPHGYLATRPQAGLSRRLLASGERLFDYAVTLLGVEDLPVKSNQFRDFTSRWSADLPSLAVAEGRTVRLRGMSGRRPVTRAVLITGETVFELGSIEGPGYRAQVSAQRGQPTGPYLKKLAEGVIDDVARAWGWGYGPEEADASTPRQVFNDVCLATCYELYRRDPVRQEEYGGAYELGRNGWARPLDLTHLLDVGCGIVIGQAELEVPDGLLVDGRPPDEVTRTVIFRQVIPPGFPGGPAGE